MKRILLSTFVFISLTVPTRAEELTLRFDPLVPSKGTYVRFVADTSGNISAEALSTLPLRSEETQNHKYVLAVDTATFQRDKFHRFSFEAYLRAVSGGERGMFQKFRVVADAVGPFPDGNMVTTFHVGESNSLDFGTIRLPIHSDDGSENISLVIPTTPQKVSFSGPSTMEFGLNNNLDLHVNIVGTDVSSSVCQPCWISPMSAKSNLNVLNPRSSTSMIMSLRPNTLKALGKSLVALNPGSAHDTVLISVASVAEQGGLVTTQEYKIPIRFAPPALYLFVTVLTGAIIGAILQYVGSSSSKWREAGFAIVIAVAVWFCALVLFSLETRVTVFGFRLDPAQLIPAGLIAFLAAGGKPVFSKVKGALGR
jgi:hypothetical protein